MLPSVYGEHVRRFTNGGSGSRKGAFPARKTEDELPKLSYILDRMPIGMVTLDAERRVTGYCDTAAAIFGEARMREALGATVCGSHSERARDKIEWLLSQAETDGASGVASMLVNMPDKVLQLRVTQLKDAGGVNGYCLVLHDVTDLTLHAQAAGAETAAPAHGRRMIKLPIPTNGRVGLLDVDQVAFLRADGHYTQVYTPTKQYFCNLSLSELEARLPDERFVRVHRSYIVNVAKARAVRQRDDQLVISVEGDPEHDIPVSRNNVSRLRRLLGV
jgi:LytTR family transcriptional regulator, CO-responsive transcriptional regulator RcoM